MRSNGGCLLVLVVCAMILGACSSGESEGSPSTPTEPPATTTTTRPGQVVVSTTAAPKEGAPGAPKAEEAAALVDKAKGRLPYPEDVLACVAGKASGDGELRAALRGSAKAKDLAAVDAVAAGCVIEVRTAPRFAEDLQRAAGGALTKEQVACAAKEFGQLTSEQVEAAAGAVLNPEKAEASATAPVKKIYETCDIEMGSR